MASVAIVLETEQEVIMDARVLRSDMAVVVAILLLAAIAILGATPARATADYPQRPVRIVTQGAAGSGPDVIARIVADHLGKLWGRGVTILNQSGAGGLVALQTAAAAEPDGYTLYLPTSTTIVILPEMHDRLPVDIYRQFTPIGIVADLPMVIAVAPSLGVSSVAELIARAKSRPGEIFYGANNRGSLPHLTGERFRREAGIEVSFVAYPGATAGLADLMGGRIQMIVESAGALAGAIKSGAVKPIGVASRERQPQLLDVPAIAETLPGFSAVGWMVLMAPAGTPQAIVQKVSDDLQSVLKSADVKQRFEDLGAFVRILSPESTDKFIRTEAETWRPIVRQVGLKAQ